MPGPSHNLPAASDSSPLVSTRLAHHLRLAALLLLVCLVSRAAWMADDAYITLRTIDNFWQGYGLRWNLLDRVQAYTHPLWMMAIGAAYGVTREAYFTTLAVSGICLAAMLVLLWRALDAWRSLLAIVALAASRAFIDYSTSGLENPLSHLLLAAFAIVWLWPAEDDRRAAPAVMTPRQLRSMAWLAAMCALVRLDLALLVAPALALAVRRTGLRRAWPALLTAGAPLAAWHLFTLVYYGSLVPNTAIAKLGTHVPRVELLRQGAQYLLDSLRVDYVTLPLIGAAILAGTVGRRAGVAHARRDTRSLALAAGLTAYVGYILWIGGDFMSGRFLTAPLVVAVLLVAHHLRTHSPRAVSLTCAVLIVAGLTSPRSPAFVWQAEPDAWRPDQQFHGIQDERAAYAHHTGLFRRLFHGARAAQHPWARAGTGTRGVPRVIVSEAVGLIGFHAGPAVHIIDPMALADPFLARLPASPGWRPGHFRRSVPEGYVESWKDCVAHVHPHASFNPEGEGCWRFGDTVNHVTEPELRDRLRDVTLVTQGPLFSPLRWSAIARLTAAQ